MLLSCTQKAGRVTSIVAMVCLPPAGGLRLGRVRCLRTGRCPLVEVSTSFSFGFLFFDSWLFGAQAPPLAFVVSPLVFDIESFYRWQSSAEVSVVVRRPCRTILGG